jgi:hypothetical protein
MSGNGQRFSNGNTTHFRVDVVAEAGVAAVVSQRSQSLFDDRGAGAVRRRDYSGHRDGSPLIAQRW